MNECMFFSEIVRQSPSGNGSMGSMPRQIMHSYLHISLAHLGAKYIMNTYVPSWQVTVWIDSLLITLNGLTNFVRTTSYVTFCSTVVLDCYQANLQKPTTTSCNIHSWLLNCQLAKGVLIKFASSPGARTLTLARWWRSLMLSTQPRFYLPDKTTNNINVHGTVAISLMLWYLVSVTETFMNRHPFCPYSFDAFFET